MEREGGRPRIETLRNSCSMLSGFSSEEMFFRALQFPTSISGSTTQKLGGRTQLAPRGEETARELKRS
jgi:hypothetical protein